MARADLFQYGTQESWNGERELKRKDAKAQSFCFSSA
jgi:hypothetical protein